MSMVIDFNESGDVVSTSGRDVGGTCTFGPWSRVASSLVQAGWGGGLKADEYVKQLVITSDGIKLVIGWKGER